MIKLPALWRSGHDTNWDGGGGGGTSLKSAWSSAGIGITSSPRRLPGNFAQACDPSCRGSVVRPRLLHNSVPRPELLGSGFTRAKLWEFDELEVPTPPPPPPFFLHGSSSSSSNTLVSSKNSHASMGNRSSNTATRVPVISYRSNGISYEKQDGAAYSVQSKRLEPLKIPTTIMAEKSTQTSRTKNVALDTSSLVSTNFGKPGTLRGGSPGPGWYSPKFQPSSPAFSMGSRFGDGKRYHSPGPGPHYVKRRPDGPAYTMSPRFRDAAKDRSPGPGQHNLPGTLGGPAYTMSPRFNSPSRGQFCSSFSVQGKGGGPGRETKSSWTKTAVEGSLNAHANAPGHGVYSSYRPEPPKKKEKKKKKEVGSFIVKVNPTGPAYKITKTGTFLMPEPDDPAFNPERRESGRRGSSNLERRDSTSRRRSSLSPRRPSSPPQTEPTPGPGEHQQAEFETSGPWITIKPRIPVRPKENFPGPGTYDVVSRPSSPSFSLGSRRFVPEGKSLNPGPGTYRIALKPHGPHFSITGRPRESRSRSRSPGPGAYKYDNGTIGYGLPSFTITGKATSPRESEVPGPGTYYVRIPKGPAFTMQSRQSSPRTRNSPGPGSYSPQRRSSSPSFSMREKLSGRDTPGPGSYTSRSSMDGPSFSMHGRLSSPDSSTSRSSTPGPGSYTIPSRPASPSFTMYGQVKKKERNDFPGPGAYCPKLGRVSPEFSIRGKLPVQQRSRSPGPGGGRSSASFSIRGKISREERPRSPGAGAYYLPKTNQVPAFSMYGGPRQDSSNSPGPGAYRSARFASPPKFRL